MKYIITEDRLQNVFNRFIKTIYEDIIYNSATKEFISTKDGDVLGYVLYPRFGDGHFFYADYSIERYINLMFGDRTNELLMTYLNSNFPGVNIKGIE